MSPQSSFVYIPGGKSKNSDPGSSDDERLVLDEINSDVYFNHTCKTSINESDDMDSKADWITISAFTESWLQVSVLYLVYLLTGGVAFLILRWKPLWRLKFWNITPCHLSKDLENIFFTLKFLGYVNDKNSRVKLAISI